MVLGSGDLLSTDKYGDNSDDRQQAPQANPEGCPSSLSESTLSYGPLSAFIPDVTRAWAC